MSTFKEIYEEAKKYYTDEDESKHRPMNPEVRYYGDGDWKLESGLYSAEDVEASCLLGDFDDFFYEAYMGNCEIKDGQDSKEFLNMISAD